MVQDSKISQVHFYCNRDQEDHHKGEQPYASTPSSLGGAEEERKDV